MREPDFVDEYYADKDLSLLKKLTLVIPTYNRNYYLSRCLWYHAHFPFGEIIVADSSSEEKKVVNRETVAKVREMFGANIRYLEYEPETEKYGGDIYRKWGDAVQYVETEYSIISTDKEFLLPITLSKSLHFLDENIDYDCVDFEKYMISSRIGDNNCYVFELAYPKRSSEESTNAVDRFYHALSLGLWNNVLTLELMRTEKRKILYKYLSAYNISDLRYGEIVSGYSPHLTGKFKYSNEFPIRIRDVIKLKEEIWKEGNKNSAESSSSRHLSFYDYNYRKEGEEHYLHYKLFLVDFLQNECSFNKIKAEMIAENLTPSFITSNNFSTKNKIYKYLGTTLWNKRVMIYFQQYFPRQLFMIFNNYIAKIVGFTFPLYFPTRKMTDDVQLVEKIISKTLDKSKDDISILNYKS